MKCWKRPVWEVERKKWKKRGIGRKVHLYISIIIDSSSETFPFCSQGESQGKGPVMLVINNIRGVGVGGYVLGDEGPQLIGFHRSCFFWRTKFKLATMAVASQTKHLIINFVVAPRSCCSHVDMFRRPAISSKGAPFSLFSLSLSLSFSLSLSLFDTHSFPFNVSHPPVVTSAMK